MAENNAFDADCRVLQMLLMRVHLMQSANQCCNQPCTIALSIISVIYVLSQQDAAASQLIMTNRSLRGWLLITRWTQSSHFLATTTCFTYELSRRRLFARTSAFTYNSS